MNSRALQLQLQAAEAAAAAAPVHAAEDGEPEATPKAPLLKIQGQGTADEPAPRQGSGLAPSMGTTGNSYATKCPECPKWFLSMKAMFGHLRKHPDRGYKGATRPTPATISAAAAVAGDNKPTKKVPRKESGVLAINMAAAAATAVEKRPWEEAETKWPAKAKRGRTPVAPMQASSCSEEEEEEAAMEEDKAAIEEEEEEEAAMILLEMSRTSSETQQQQPVEPVRAPDAVSGHQIQTSDVEELMLLHHPAGQQIPEAAQIVQLENALELSAESQTPAAKHVTDLVISTEAVLIMVPANKAIFPSLDSGAGDKKPKKRRVTNPGQTVASTSPPPPEGAVRTPPARRIPSPASDKRHTCPSCGKSFLTHQALGGHMASHVKGKTTSSARHNYLAASQAMHKHNILAHRDKSAGNGDVIILPASAGAGAGKGALQERQDAQPPPALAPTPQTPAMHVCDDCSQTFHSGQALGGHKRKHWFRQKQQATAALPAPAPVPEPDESRDFDLNELPKEGQGEDNNQP